MRDTSIGHAGVDAQRADQIVDLAGRHAVHIPLSGQLADDPDRFGKRQAIDF
jgi:hypothetical protein